MSLSLDPQECPDQGDLAEIVDGLRDLQGLYRVLVLIYIGCILSRFLHG